MSWVWALAESSLGSRPVCMTSSLSVSWFSLYLGGSFFHSSSLGFIFIPDALVRLSLFIVSIALTFVFFQLETYLLGWGLCQHPHLRALSPGHQVFRGRSSATSRAVSVTYFGWFGPDTL